MTAVPKSDLQVVEALSPHSIRYGREIGAILLIYLEAMAYAATSPIILPFTLIYFAAAWIHWRYNILYVSERCYESGGRAWDMTFKCMLWILFIFELFTGNSRVPTLKFAPCPVSLGDPRIRNEISQSQSCWWAIQPQSLGNAHVNALLTIPGITTCEKQKGRTRGLPKCPLSHLQS